MQSNTTSARPERADQPRLGDKLNLIAKWAHAEMIHKRENPLVPLSAFSPEDQEKLFKKPRYEYKFERDENNHYHLKKYQVGEESTLDPDLKAFIRTPRYKRYQAKMHELMCVIEDASPEADMLKAAATKAGKLARLGDKGAQAVGQHTFNKHADHCSTVLTARWKQEKIERQKGPHSQFELDALNNPAPAPVREPTPVPTVQHTLTANDMRRMVEDSFKASVTGRVRDTHSSTQPVSPPPGLPHFDPLHSVYPHPGLPQSVVSQVTLQVKPGDPHSANSSPPHGSETTGNSLSSGSPPFFPFPDGWHPSHSARASIDSVNSPANLFNGGAPLDPFFNGFQQHGPVNYQEGHLGAGLNRFFYSSSMTTGVTFSAAPEGGYLSSPHGDFVHISTTDTYAEYSRCPPAPPTPVPLPHGFGPAPVYGNQSDSEASFATQRPISNGFPLAACQPFHGMTCYDVQYQTNKDVLAPEYWTTSEGKAQYAIAKTLDLKLEDSRLLKNPGTGYAASQPLHIFVDLSNIIIGFYDSLKMKRGLPIQKRVSPPPFSFNVLDVIITRGRQVAKKVVAGSIAGTKKRRPDYMLQAEALGYEMNILQRVLKPVSPPFKRKSKNVRELESATSETSGDDGLAVPMKNGEQGVDEVLHLKILQSTIDFKPGATMVLASGDAAHAEYSDGFKSNVERALDHGWNVELYGWSRNISSAWRDPAFTAKWSEKFRIIELDTFCEELFDMTIESLSRD